MTPKELVDITLDRARTDLLYDLERLEYECERPVHQVDNNLVECFKGYALNRLIKLCAQYRKGHRGESERKIIIGANTFYVFKLTANHTLVMDNLSPAELRWIPEDLEDILEHFAESLADSCTKVQEIVNDYWTMRKAGDIATSTVSALLKPTLDKEGYEIRIICKQEEVWNCSLHSEQKGLTYGFLSNAERVQQDIIRILRR
jgi:hypothetical protein